MGHLLELRFEFPDWVPSKLYLRFLQRYLPIKLWNFDLQHWEPMYCVECGNTLYGFDMYMVKDEIWAEAVERIEDNLHLDCLVKRLGRDLEATDFTEYPINNSVLFLWRQQYRKEMR